MEPVDCQSFGGFLYIPKLKKTKRFHSQFQHMSRALYNHFNCFYVSKDAYLLFSSLVAETENGNFKTTIIFSNKNYEYPKFAIMWSDIYWFIPFSTKEFSFFLFSCFIKAFQTQKVVENGDFFFFLSFLATFYHKLSREQKWDKQTK